MHTIYEHVLGESPGLLGSPKKSPGLFMKMFLILLTMAQPTPPTTFVSQAFLGQRLAKRSLKNEASGLLCGSQNGAKMAPRGLRGPLGRQLGSRSLPGRLPKRSRRPPGPKTNSLLSSGGPPEKFPSEISPSQGVPGSALGLILGALGAHFGPPFGDRC